MLIKSISVVVLGALMSSMTYASVDIADVKVAQAQVNDYRALRRACAITQGEQRYVCFSQLNEATEGYKKAKQVLSLYQSSEDQQLLGQAQ